MRSQIYLLLTFCFLSAACYGQLGIQLGWNTSGYSYKYSGTTENRGNKWGVNTGLVYRTKGKKLGLLPQLLYTQKGAINDNTGANYAANVLQYTNKLDYLEFAIPAILKIKWFDGVYFDLGAGPYVSKLVSAKSKIEDLNGDFRTAQFKIGSDSTDDFKPIDAGLILYSALKIKHFYMSLCYEMGMSNVTPAKNLEIKNGCFNINMGILF